MNHRNRALELVSTTSDAASAAALVLATVFVGDQLARIADVLEARQEPDAPCKQWTPETNEEQPA